MNMRKYAVEAGFGIRKRFIDLWLTASAAVLDEVEAWAGWSTDSPKRACARDDNVEGGK